jgi:hypothetical protein
MKIDVEFTHWGFFYGLPAYLNFEGDGIFPLPIIPLTGWWLSLMVPVIQYLQEAAVALFYEDHPASGGFFVYRRPLRCPFTKTFDWPEDACRDFRPSAR